MSRLHSIYSTLLVMQQPLLKHLKEMGKKILIVVVLFHQEVNHTRTEFHHDIVWGCSTKNPALHFPTNVRTFIEKEVSAYIDRHTHTCMCTYISKCIQKKSHIRKSEKALLCIKTFQTRHYRQTHSLKISALSFMPLERVVIQSSSLPTGHTEIAYK